MQITEPELEPAIVREEGNLPFSTRPFPSTDSNFNPSFFFQRLVDYC